MVKFKIKQFLPDFSLSIKNIFAQVLLTVY